MSSDFGAYGYYANAAPPSAPPTSVYGEQRPTFSEDGTGAPYTALLNLVGTAAVNNDISYDTSSKDPHMIRARVFIGNIARAIITRDDIIELFRPFGKILAVNYFAQQGFGFVQFNEAAHADKSCLTLNGQQWKTCCLDVHLAMLGSLAKTEKSERGRASVAPIPASLSGQPAPPKTEVAAAQSAKRPYEEEEYEIFKQNKRNKQFANGDKTVNEDLAPNEMCDTMVCGYCRFVTSDFEEFKDHRIAGCNRFKDPDEPRHRLKCATCNQRFLGAWGLLEHLTEFHRMLLYNEEKITKDDLSQMRSSSVSQDAPPTQDAPNDAPGAHEQSAEPVDSVVSNQGTPSTPQVE